MKRDNIYKEIESTIEVLVMKKKQEFVYKHYKFPKILSININIYRLLEKYLRSKGKTIKDFENKISMTIRTTKEKIIKVM